MDEARLKPQAVSGPSPEARTRMAMQIGAAMHEAQTELVRPDIGEEAAERAGRAARAAAMAFHDGGNMESPGFAIPIVIAIAQQAYATEWTRLANTPRELWRA